MSNSTRPNPTPARPAADWRLYAAAGAAALAATGATDAAIITGTANVTATLNENAPFAKSSVVKKSFTIDGLHESVAVHAGRDSIVGPGGRSAQGKVAYIAGALRPFVSESASSLRRNAVDFAPGAAIRGTTNLVNSAVLNNRLNTGTQRGSFANGKTGIVGFQLPASKGGGDGWFRVELTDTNGDGFTDQLEALDYAYNDAGGGITAPTSPSVPEPSALGLLAMGSAGVLAWRRRRSAAVAT